MNYYLDTFFLRKDKYDLFFFTTSTEGNSLFQIFRDFQCLTIPI